MLRSRGGGEYEQKRARDNRQAGITHRSPLMQMRLGPILSPLSPPFVKRVLTAGCERSRYRDRSLVVITVPSSRSCEILRLPSQARASMSPSNTPVCLAIISSSLVGITQAETLLEGAEMRWLLPAFALASSSTPRHTAV